MGTKLELTPAIRQYIEEKIGSCADMLERFEEGGELTAFVELARNSNHHVHGDVYYAEVRLSVPGKAISVEAESSDARAAIDEVKDLLKLELRKHKEKTYAKTVRKSKKED
jgi:ribosomal subunit interface protein